MRTLHRYCTKVIFRAAIPSLSYTRKLSGIPHLFKTVKATWKKNGPYHKSKHDSLRKSLPDLLTKKIVRKNISLHIKTHRKQSMTGKYL